MSPSYFFTADTHFGHANIIKYCNRPFGTVDEMDEALIARWNEVVTPRDIVFHIGDFGFCTPAVAAVIAGRLNGRKFLVYGNHDEQYLFRSDRHGPSLAFKRQFAGVNAILEEKIDGQRVVMCHYAMRVWNKSHRGSWQLHGHSHGTLPSQNGLLQLDVGVDCWNYRPVSFDEIRAQMSEKNYAPVDHHGVRHVNETESS